MPQTFTHWQEFGFLFSHSLSFVYCWDGCSDMVDTQFVGHLLFGVYSIERCLVFETKTQVIKGEYVKQILVLCGLLLVVSLGEAKPLPKQETATETQNDAKAEDEIFSVLNIKLFHDRQIVQSIVLNLYDQQTSGVQEWAGMTEGVFRDQNSNALAGVMDGKKIKYKVTPELLNKANVAPFEAFKDLIISAEVPQITREEIKNVRPEDRLTTSEFLQMISESGPDLGANPVAVIYHDETQTKHK